MVIVLSDGISRKEWDSNWCLQVVKLSQLQPILKQLLPLQERQSEDDDADVIVKIFVEFKTTSYAKAARDALVS